MVGNTGTYLDCPFHRYENGKDLSDIKLRKLVNLQGVIIPVSNITGLEISVDHFLDKELTGKAVLVHTGWSRYWQTDQYYEDHPYLSEDAAIYLKGWFGFIFTFPIYPIPPACNYSQWATLFFQSRQYCLAGYLLYQY